MSLAEWDWLRTEAPPEFFDEWNSHFTKYPPLPELMTEGFGRVCQMLTHVEKGKPMPGLDQYFSWCRDPRAVDDTTGFDDILEGMIVSRMEEERG